MWRHLVEREDEVQQQVMRLTRLRHMEERIEWDTYMEWRKQVADGKLRIEQLHKLLAEKYNPRFVESTLDRVLNSYLYPSLKAVRVWNSLHMLITPDGVTDKLVYEYRSVAEPKDMAGSAQAMRTLAQMEALLLERRAIQVQIRARATDDVQTINEPLDPILARAYLDAAERGLKEIASLKLNRSHGLPQGERRLASTQTRPPQGAKMNSSNRQAIRSDNAPAAIGPYSQAMRSGNLVFCSGQLAIRPSTGQIDEGDWSIGQQTRQALTNLKAVLEAAGTDLAHVVKTTVFLAHISDFAEMNSVYTEFFPAEQTPPARSTVEVGRLPKDGLVEIECIAVMP